jgi:vacuolar iron transporter family protein
MTQSTKISARPAEGKSNKRLNWLRAAVLGANDGIVSIAGLVVGVAGASDSFKVIFTAGMAGVIAGALSMAAGEYVSVSSQRDTEKALLARQHSRLKDSPEDELEGLTQAYEAKGLSRTTAAKVATELTTHDALRAHADARLGLNPDDLTNPWHAATASAAAFVAGSVVPIVAILVPPTSIRVPVAFASVIVALACTGAISARVGGASKRRATLRVIVGGALAMAITYSIGEIFGVAGV